MADQRLDIAPDYDENAQPEELQDDDVVRGLRRLRELSYLKDQLEQERTALLRQVIPMLKRPATLLDPITGEPIFAVASQAKPYKVDINDLKRALFENFSLGREGTEEELRDVNDLVDRVVSSVLKPPEVDATQGGRFLQAAERGDIPLEVVAKVAKEKPSNATVRFTVPERHR